MPSAASVCDRRAAVSVSVLTTPLKPEAEAVGANCNCNSSPAGFESARSGSPSPSPFPKSPASPGPGGLHLQLHSPQEEEQERVHAAFDVEVAPASKAKKNMNNYNVDVPMPKRNANKRKTGLIGGGLDFDNPTSATTTTFCSTTTIYAVPEGTATTAAAGVDALVSNIIPTKNEKEVQSSNTTSGTSGGIHDCGNPSKTSDATGPSSNTYTGICISSNTEAVSSSNTGISSNIDRETTVQNGLRLRANIAVIKDHLGIQNGLRLQNNTFSEKEIVDVAILKTKLDISVEQARAEAGDTGVDCREVCDAVMDKIVADRNVFIFGNDKEQTDMVRAYLTFMGFMLLNMSGASLTPGLSERITYIVLHVYFSFNVLEVELEIVTELTPLDTSQKNFFRQYQDIHDADLFCADPDALLYDYVHLDRSTSSNCILRLSQCFPSHLLPAYFARRWWRLFGFTNVPTPSPLYASDMAQFGVVDVAVEADEAELYAYGLMLGVGYYYERIKRKPTERVAFECPATSRSEDCDIVAESFEFDYVLPSKSEVEPSSEFVAASGKIFFATAPGPKGMARAATVSTQEPASNTNANSYGGNVQYFNMASMNSVNSVHGLNGLHSDAQEAYTYASYDRDPLTNIIVAHDEHEHDEHEHEQIARADFLACNCDPHASPSAGAGPGFSLSGPRPPPRGGPGGRTQPLHLPFAHNGGRRMRFFPPSVSDGARADEKVAPHEKEIIIDNSLVSVDLTQLAGSGHDIRLRLPPGLGVTPGTCEPSDPAYSQLQLPADYEQHVAGTAKDIKDHLKSNQNQNHEEQGYQGYQGPLEEQRELGNAKKNKITVSVRDISSCRSMTTAGRTVEHDRGFKQIVVASETLDAPSPCSTLPSAVSTDVNSTTFVVPLVPGHYKSDNANLIMEGEKYDNAGSRWLFKQDLGNIVKQDSGAKVIMSSGTAGVSLAALPSTRNVSSRDAHSEIFQDDSHLLLPEIFQDDSHLALPPLFIGGPRAGQQQKQQQERDASSNSISVSCSPAVSPCPRQWDVAVVDHHRDQLLRLYIMSCQTQRDLLTEKENRHVVDTSLSQHRIQELISQCIDYNYVDTMEEEGDDKTTTTWNKKKPLQMSRVFANAAGKKFVYRHDFWDYRLLRRLHEMVSSGVAIWSSFLLKLFIAANELCMKRQLAALEFAKKKIRADFGWDAAKYYDAYGGLEEVDVNLVAHAHGGIKYVIVPYDFDPVDAALSRPALAGAYDALLWRLLEGSCREDESAAHAPGCLTTDDLRNALGFQSYDVNEALSLLEVEVNQETSAVTEALLQDVTHMAVTEALLQVAGEFGGALPSQMLAELYMASMRDQFVPDEVSKSYVEEHFPKVFGSKSGNKGIEKHQVQGMELFFQDAQEQERGRSVSFQSAAANCNPNSGCCTKAVEPTTRSASESNTQPHFFGHHHHQMQQQTQQQMQQQQQQMHPATASAYQHLNPNQMLPLYQQQNQNQNQDLMNVNLNMSKQNLMKRPQRQPQRPQWPKIVTGNGYFIPGRAPPYMFNGMSDFNAKGAHLQVLLQWLSLAIVHYFVQHKRVAPYTVRDMNAASGAGAAEAVEVEVFNFATCSPDELSRDPSVGAVWARIG